MILVQWVKEVAFDCSMSIHLVIRSLTQKGKALLDGIKNGYEGDRH